ncbi:MAG TPA: GyrI-like domain-containing protein [Flavobacterium sp.]|nr:GyrI-like domain-containing protein [Flavobacterium sp.]
MKNTSIDSFSVIGISVRTTNEDNQAAIDIPALWNRFISENIQAKIPDKTDDSIYSVYTDYEKDFTKPYTTILGCKVSNLDTIPEGMIGRTFEKAVYRHFIAKGNLSQDAVYKKWEEIWNSGMDRKYTADFEIYGEKSRDFENAEVDIFVAV